MSNSNLKNDEKSQIIDINIELATVSTTGNITNNKDNINDLLLSVFKTETTTTSETLGLQRLSSIPNESIASEEIISTPTTSRNNVPSKRPPYLNLTLNKNPKIATNITSAINIAETENATLSKTNNIATETQASSLSAASTPTYTKPPLFARTSSPATIFPHEQWKIIKNLNIGFENIAYSAKTGLFKRVNKQILNGLTGHFNTGDLSAIIGPSGAGKSTLLNILSAYTSYGYTGDITVNGNLRDIKAFKPNLAFIMQDTSLQPYLTVKEAMHFAANLKIGTHMTTMAKKERVRRILEAIGMYENRHTRTINLSGGQKKRLAIALELVNNPPVLILDEPTSGLDSSTSTQLIVLLKKLSIEGRTVICTIHQPSALTFEMFDHLYAIAEGQCIYAGGTSNLVPFLAECDLHCPESYNPADYLMEIATNDYGKLNYKLVERIENGRNASYRQGKIARKTQMDAMNRIDKMMAASSMTPVTAPILSPPLITNTPKNLTDLKLNNTLSTINEMSSKNWDNGGLPNATDNINAKENEKNSCSSNYCKTDIPKVQRDTKHLCKRENIYATPFYKQLIILLLRTFLILWRDQSLTTMRFVIHFVTALLIGFLYYGIGNDASNALNNFRYTFYTIMFIMYCAFSSILVKFPLEFPIVSREHFNRWYSLRAYYVAMTLADIPIQIICTSLFVFTTYFLTGQPIEPFRLGLFSMIVFLTALVGQSIGLTVGASLSVQLGAIFGPFFICPFLTFSGFFLQHKDAPIYLKWMFHISFLKYSLDGTMLALFGYERPKMECDDMYCHYTRPNFLLKDLDMLNANYKLAAIFLFSLFLGLRIIAFYIMSFRLRLFR